MSTVKKGPYYEYSVVYTDRVFNLMSPPFQETMRDINNSLVKTYNAHISALIPGSGTYAMEAVARAFATDKKVLVIRNGYFSFRWSDIFNVCKLPSEEIVMKAGPIDNQGDSKQPQIAPAPLDQVIAKIKSEKPAAVFMPHVETATGILCPDDYIKAVAAAAHEVGATLVVDGIAAGCVWLDMKALGVDVYITAPQKGWTGPCCVGIVVLNKDAAEKVAKSSSTSFCCNLPQWLDVMQQYLNEDGKGPGFRYYTTLPTDALMEFRDVMKEAEAVGLASLKEKMWQQGKAVRAELAKRGFKSVAAEGFESPGVVVVYSPVTGMVGKIKSEGLQLAGGVPWKLEEETYGVDSAASTFRIGLFGLDKLANVDGTVERLMKAIDNVCAQK